MATASGNALRTIIGEVNVSPNDYSAHAALHHTVELSSVPYHRLTERDWISAPHDTRLRRLTEWIISLGINTIVTAAQSSSKTVHQEIGRLSWEAAFAATQETDRPVTILESHGRTGRQGNWVPITGAYNSIVAPRPLGHPHPDTTYTRHFIDPAVLLSTASAEDLVAIGEV